MGLDLMMFRESDYNTYKRTGDYKDLNPEILYGRKTWSLYYFFRNRKDTFALDDEIYAISRKAFEDFEILMLPYADFLDLVLNADEDTELDEDLIEKIYDKVFDIPASLGEGWDVRCFARWYAALPDVYKIYDDGDALVMIASY